MQALIRYPALHLAAGQLEHGGRVRRQRALSVFTRTLLIECSVNRDIGFRVGEFEARILELTNLLAKGLTLLHILRGDFERALRGGHSLRGDTESLSR